MLYFANKLPGVLVFVCFANVYTTNCGLILMTGVIAIIVLAEVILNAK